MWYIFYQYSVNPETFKLLSIYHCANDFIKIYVEYDKIHYFLLKVQKRSLKNKLGSNEIDIL